jgi:hypothetical protein
MAGLTTGLQSGISLGNAFAQGRQRAKDQQLQDVINSMQLDESRKGALFKDARMVNSYLKANQPQQALSVLSNRIDFINKFGGDPADTLEVVDLISKGEFGLAQDLLSSVDAAGVAGGYIEDPRVLEANLARGSAESRAFYEMIKDLTPIEQKLAKRIKLGLSPRAVGSASQTISQDEQLTQDVAQTEKIISAAKETGKLASKFKLQPKIAEAVGIANTKVKEIADDTKLSKSNNKALSVYEVGIKALSEALGQTSTGPIIDILPALTANAQSAEGAIAMMGPTLKSVFREAGEGTFTEGDQKLLMDMLPTRKDLPAARDFKMKTIDAMIRLKLGGNAGAENNIQTQQDKQQTQVVDWSDL